MRSFGSSSRLEDLVESSGIGIRWVVGRILINGRVTAPGWQQVKRHMVGLGRRGM